ncbi:MAG: DNA replication complex GINS family protein [Planctomycetota bacterium]|jgi:hypothetical protein
MHASTRITLSTLLLGSFLCLAAGCTSGPADQGGVKGGVVAPGGTGPIASVRMISFDDMVRKGNAAMNGGRYRAASLYYGAALTVRPYSRDAREKLAQAQFNLSRKKIPGEVTESEGSLPPPDPEIMEDVDQLILRLERESGLLEEEEPVVFGVEPEEDERIRESILDEELPHEDIPKYPKEEKGERPRIERSSITTWIGVPSRMPCKPLRTGRNNLFHVLLHIPAMEGARTLPSKIWSIESGYDGSVGHLTHGAYGRGLFIRYDNNRYDEGYLKFAHALTDNIEVRSELTLGNLREGDFDVYVSYDFDPYIQPYDRRGDLGNVLLGVKTRLYRPFRREPETGITTEVSLKIPSARNPKNFTTTGMPDVAVQLMGTFDLYRYVPWPRVIPTAAAGVTIPFGEIYFDRDVDLDPVFFFGLGSVIQLDDMLALIGQIQGNTSAFGEFSPLAGMVLTSHIGVRVLLGNFIIEAGFGHGFTGTSFRYQVNLNIGFQFEGQELIEEILR